MRPPDPSQSEVPVLANAELAAIYYGQRKGGDFYDFVRVSSKRVLFGLLDVAGRLEDNRAIIAAAQHTFRTQGAALLADDGVNEAEAMVELYLRLNRAILEAEGGVRASTGIAGCYNEELGVVCYFNAGHTPGLARSEAGVSELAATGLPLGLFSHATCDAGMLALEPRGVLLIVSRGIVEARRRSDEFGLSRVKDNLLKNRGNTAKQYCVSVINEVQEFMKTPPTHNDVTALSLLRGAAS